jgi:hypothetical protein
MRREVQDYLNDMDIEILRKRRQEGKVDLKNPLSFEPTYAIRPTIEQVVNKGKYWDLGWTMGIWSLWPMPLSILFYR